MMDGLLFFYLASVSKSLLTVIGTLSESRLAQRVALFPIFHGLGLGYGVSARVPPFTADCLSCGFLRHLLIVTASTTAPKSPSGKDRPRLSAYPSWRPAVLLPSVLARA
jgi:hypothetical protein